MTKVLYITAHPHDEQASYSMAVGSAFVKAYREAHPENEVVHLDLYRLDIPQIDNDVFSGWGKLASGQDFKELTADEQHKVSRLGELVDQFVSADQYVFVTPLWNLSFPPVLKAYIDAVSVAGKTFKYTAEGPVGLLSGRKALHIQATGGFYSNGPAAELEMGDRYLRTITRFYGIEDYSLLRVEGMAYAPEKAAEIKAEAIERAKGLAKTF
ncbi:FMN-dependent NADH-azoreductase [Gorillibacterium timonense]|uniref:FMN-dependent NADH-azoreductase n=1 Tax=Gorillibacterium timonense TaxID=1689269 RepID=UPI00071D590D|nr:FMN-dependent NADH-azoreductase [Gorillibacterium timonense]